MTVIAWDGKTLAADRRVCTGNGVFETGKICRVNGHLIGITGNLSAGLELVEWYRSGADPEKFPPVQRDQGTSGGMLVIHPNGRAYKYGEGPIASPYFDKQIAFGSGGDFARAAMHCGRSAVEAVMVACMFDPNCGGGIDTLHLQ